MAGKDVEVVRQVEPVVVPVVSDQNDHWWHVFKFQDSVSAIYVTTFGIAAICTTAMGATALISGDAGGWFFLMGTAGIGGAFSGLTKLMYHAVGKWEAAEVKQFNTWRKWLFDKYGLILTNEQNNALVTDRSGKGISISVNGQATRIKLARGSIDATVEHTILVKRKLDWVALPKQQMSAPAMNPGTEIFPDYSMLPKWLQPTLRDLHGRWTALNKIELSVEDRYTVTAIVRDYLPQSLALFNAIPEKDNQKRTLGEWLLLDQLQALDRQLTEIEEKQAASSISAMKAHGLFLNGKAPLRAI